MLLSSFHMSSRNNIPEDSSSDDDNDNNDENNDEIYDEKFNKRLDQLEKLDVEQISACIHDMILQTVNKFTAALIDHGVDKKKIDAAMKQYIRDCSVKGVPIRKPKIVKDPSKAKKVSGASAHLSNITSNKTIKSSQDKRDNKGFDIDKSIVYDYNGQEYYLTKTLLYTDCYVCVNSNGNAIFGWDEHKQEEFMFDIADIRWLTDNGYKVENINK